MNFRPVEADAGAIGGNGGTHKFMALAEIGEDTIVSCVNCDYAASENIELADAAITEQLTGAPTLPFRPVTVTVGFEEYPDPG